MIVGVGVGIPFGNVNKKKYSLSFDGVDDYVTTVTGEVLQNAITYELWVKRNGAGSSANEFIIGKSVDVGQYEFALDFQNGGANIACSVNSTGFTDINLAMPAAASLWNHFAVTYEYPGETKLYVNGQLLGSVVSKKDAISPGANLTFAKIRSNYSKVQIKDVRKWNFSKTQAAIQTDMNRDLGNEPGLINRWKFLEGSGSKLYDSISTNHGDIYGAVWSES